MLLVVSKEAFHLLKQSFPRTSQAHQPVLTCVRCWVSWQVKMCVSRFGRETQTSDQSSRKGMLLQAQNYAMKEYSDFKVDHHLFTTFNKNYIHLPLNIFFYYKAPLIVQFYKRSPRPHPTMPCGSMSPPPTFVSLDAVVSTNDPGVTCHTRPLSWFKMLSFDTKLQT